MDCLITLHTLHSPGSCHNPLQEEPAFPGMGPIQGGAKYYSLSYFKLGKGEKTIEDMFLMFIVVHSLCVNSVIPV